MKLKIILSIIAVFSIISCGGSDSNSDLSGTYSVDDVNILANDINIGEQVRVEVFFETETEVDGTPDGVDLVVRIPAELSFVSNTSELYDNSTNNSDPFTPNNIVDCPTGETYLIYNFSDFDLFQHELTTLGKFGLKFHVRGKISTPETLVGASAGTNQGFICGQFFAAEQNEAIEVLK